MSKKTVKCNTFDKGVSLLSLNNTKDIAQCPHQKYHVKKPLEGLL